MDCAPIAGNQVIETCEVANDNIVKNVLSARRAALHRRRHEVSAMSDRMHKDSVSLGIAFTAKLRELVATRSAHAGRWLLPRAEGVHSPTEIRNLRGVAHDALFLLATMFALVGV